MKLTVGKLKEMLRDIPDNATIGSINLPNEDKIKVFSEFVRVIDRNEFQELYLDHNPIDENLDYDFYL